MRVSFVAAVALLAAVAHTAHGQVNAKELSSIDFSAMIGGPLQAVINAQASAAMNTVDFINAVGFDEDKKAINVMFAYNITNGTTGERQENSIEVPLLTIIPIPFIRVQECTIEFNAKIQSTTKTSSENVASNSGSSSRSLDLWLYKSSSTASYSNKKTDKSSNEEKREFTLNIKVRAVQDDMPAGMAKILGVLEEAILISARKQLA